MSTALRGVWQHVHKIESHRYTCGHCGSDITTEVGYWCEYDHNKTAYIYVCHHCNLPTLFKSGQQVPGSSPGATVGHLPKDIEELYQEIRDATAAGAYTAAVMSGRKLLMHIAVECGDKKDKSFEQYVDFLVENHHTPPNSRVWVDKIRKLGNEANHQIKIMGSEEAANIIKFLEMLLKFMYEFPASIVDEGAPAGAK